MEQKTKVILIVVGIILLIFIGVLIAANSSLMNQIRVHKEDKEALAAQNERLGVNLEKERREKRNLQSRLAEMKRALDDAERIRRERDDLQRKYDRVKTERDNILKELSAKKKVAKPRALPVGTEDEAYWSGILKAKTELELKLTKLKEKLGKLNNNLEVLQKEKASLQLDIDNLTNDNKELSAKLIYNEKLIDLMSLDLVREKKNRRKIQDNFKTIRKENEVLKKELKTINKQKVRLEEKVQRLAVERRDLEGRIMAVNATLDDKVAEILEIRQRLEDIKEEKGIKLQREQKVAESVELPAIVVRSPETAPRVSLGISAKVLEVNRKNGFVILDAGEDAGVRRGMTFVVYRNGSRIGIIEVVQTRKSVSACDIKQASDLIKVGDIVK